MIKRVRQYLSRILFIWSLKVSPQAFDLPVHEPSEADIISTHDHMRFIGNISINQMCRPINNKYLHNPKLIISAVENISFKISGEITLAAGEKLMIIP